MKEKFHYKKSMGQHFLLDSALVERLAEASGVQKGDGVLEVGPGRGLLTAALARRARKLIAVELDLTLLNGLEVAMGLYPNVEIVQGDILKADLPALVAELGTPCRLAANLPYNITTPFLEKLLRARLPLQSIALMVQKEAGARMLAQVGDEGYGPLSLLVGYYCTGETVLEVPAACFTPPPKVDSVFLRLTPREASPCPDVEEALLFRVITASFAMRRKTMLNNLTAGFALSREKAEALLLAADVPPSARAETLDLQAFARIVVGLSTTT
ncbi:MAG: 16S rRNA (adenine(1518)-N(6)/adenine(1519)-N(6))-dimethyltransferase RsmA [Oscillospiraceae bacterium]|jgi:16S rRNA (adenine1518-N6/adenine1519-N6)-dimethyltransferase|nr:16S rRNA (adenine(1518)-N(6)/adenine(1519)-N(6))-dimethyltransferase RsmA [Oscillospiraceae bacterium]